MPTPSTRTPVRIARGSYSNLNGSLSDLQDGEISYAEDQDKLYIKEGGSLVALTYTPASPAFTGTITGVNLTLSGNLTVNGTQTIINTQTLDVEDKQIEIGKVSSPSDTTADQGGIKLKGATDKTFLWVNATDAWTSSENIVLAANKRLLIGTTTEGHADADDLTIATTANTGLTIRSGTSNFGQLFFSDATSGTDEYKGYIQYGHNTDSLFLGSNATVALTLNSSQNATFAGTITANNKVTCDNGSGSGYLSADGGSTKVGSFSNHRLDLVINNTQKAKLETNGNFTVTSGTVSDSKGELRSIPYVAKTSSYSLVYADAGKAISSSSGGWTVPNNLFLAGNAVTLLNVSSGDLTITQGSGMSMYFANDGSTGNRTLATRGICTIYFLSGSTSSISGAGLS